MKKAFLSFAVLALVALAACSLKTVTTGRRGGDALVFRVHFIGTEQLWAGAESAKLKEMAALQSSPALRDEVLNRLALLPSFWLADALPQGAAPQTNLFRPLLDDLLAQESYVDCTAAPELVVAARVSNERAALWQKNLREALTAWKLGAAADVKVDGAAGWEIKRTGLPGVFLFLRAGEWVVFTAGSGTSARATEMLASIKANGRPARPTGAWLDGDVNLARLDGWLPALENFQNLPVAHFSLSNRADYVRTYATLDFPKAHGWKSEPWQVPTNAIRDPLVSFLAVRGLAPVLEAFPALRDLGYKPTPNQIFGWGHAQLPFQFHYAAPSSNVRPQLKTIAPKVEKLVLGAAPARYSGVVNWDTNSQEIVWRGLPLASPHLGEIRVGGREYLSLGAFPAMRSTNMMPPELSSALMGRPELVAFDYEITGQRIMHWRQFYQLAEIASRRALTPTNFPTEKWLLDAYPKLGESVTELRATSATQMTLVRKSQIGFNAGEIVTLAHWLESTNFPAFGVFPAQAVRRGPGRAGAPVKSGK